MTEAPGQGPEGPVVVLVGPMGAGKSTVAALLAERWGVAARDTDADVEAALAAVPAAIERLELFS